MNRNIYMELMNILKSGRNTVMVTRFSGDHGSLKHMDKKLMADSVAENTSETISGNAVKNTDESDDADLAEKALVQGIPLTYLEGEKTLLIEPFYPEERLIVLGGGHIALPLTDFVARIGFAVTVVDDRPQFANRLRFPAAKDVICNDFMKAIEQLRITSNDYVVIITRGHRHDQACLEQLLLSAEPFYTGMIGSRRRVSAVKDLLIEQGFDQKRLDRIHTPIGLSIGAVTPAEIAIAIAAELIACKRIRKETVSGQERFANRSDVDMDVLRVLAEEQDEPKSIVTVITAKGSVPRGAGAKMLVYPFGKIVGSIGGGCSEAAVINDARAIIGTGGYLLKTVDMTAEAAESEGMVCGGVMQVLIEDY